jgi:hypothetical protein
MYQQFKFDIIAHLPLDKGWRIPQVDVLDWVNTFGHNNPAAAIR